MKTKTALLIPDTHRPYHDRRAYSLMIKVARDVGPDEIVILGDYLDMYGVNFHGKSPAVPTMIKDEIKDANKALDELDRLFPKAKKVFIMGNHEYRLQRYIDSKCPDLFGIVPSLEQLLKFDQRGWISVPYTPSQKYKVLGSKLVARHEPIGGSEHCAASTVKKAGSSVVFGHVHRIQEHQTVMINDDNYRGISIGWLGDKTHEVFSYVKGHHQWAMGFGLVTALPDGTFFHNTIHIIDYKCVYAGKVYSA